MSLQDLTHGAGALLLAELADHDPGDTLGISTRLRARGFDAALVAQALTQARLRQRALPRWGPAARQWWFTAPGLEQATRPAVAALHAARYVRAGMTEVADLCCGIGSDASAFADAGLAVTAVDLDGEACEAAELNLGGRASVRQQDALTTSLGQAAFVDPSRRSHGARTYDPQAWSPPLDAVLALDVPALGLKVAPGIDHAAVPAGWQAEWVSVDGDVLEAGLWSPALKDEGVTRSANLLGRAVITDVGMPEAPVGPVGAWLHEPDGAVIRAGLVGAVLCGGRLVDPTIAYVTTDDEVSHPALTSYRVRDVLPFGLKSLRGYLRERDVGILTVKKRGTAVEPEQLRKQLRLSGSATATVVLTRVAGQQSVLVVEPFI